ILNDTNVHAIRIEISDIKKNTSELNFKVKVNATAASLANNIPHKSFPPGNVNIFEENDFELYLNEQCLYDSVQPVFSRVDQPGPGAISSLFRVADASIPVHGEINIRIKPNIAIPEELTDKVILKRIDGENITVGKAEWQRHSVAAKFSDFGSYQAFLDTTSPSVNNLGTADTIDLSSSKRIVFYPQGIGGIRFRAELDNQWLMFTNDKAAAWVYTFDERCPYGVHRLKVIIEDIVGNVTEKQWWFKRNPYSPRNKKAPGKKPALSKKKKSTAKKK